MMSNFSHLEDQVRECFGRAVYTHKTHEKMADRCGRTLRRFKWAQILVSAVTASGALSAVLIEEQWITIATAVASIITLIISGYMKGFDPGGSAQKHRDAAAAIWPVRESYLSLLTDLRMERIDVEEGARRRDQLQEQLAAIYKGAPQTSPEAYADASAALKKLEEYTFADSEIDKFVPISLRKESVDPASL